MPPRLSATSAMAENQARRPVDDFSKIVPAVGCRCRPHRLHVQDLRDSVVR